MLLSCSDHGLRSTLQQLHGSYEAPCYIFADLRETSIRENPLFSGFSRIAATGIMFGRASRFIREQLRAKAVPPMNIRDADAFLFFFRNRVVRQAIAYVATVAWQET